MHRARTEWRVVRCRARARARARPWSLVTQLRSAPCTVASRRGRGASPRLLRFQRSGRSPGTAQHPRRRCGEASDVPGAGRPGRHALSPPQCRLRRRRRAALPTRATTHDVHRATAGSWVPSVHLSENVCCLLRSSRVRLVHAHRNDETGDRGERGDGVDGGGDRDQVGEDAGEEGADGEAAVAPEPVDAD